MAPKHEQTARGGARDARWVVSPLLSSPPPYLPILTMYDKTNIQARRFSKSCESGFGESSGSPSEISLDDHEKGTWVKKKWRAVSEELC